MTTTSPRVPPRVHALLLVGSLLVAGFSFLYARLVCVYICALPAPTLFRNIAVVSGLHAVLRFQLLEH
jgi:adenylate cyclase